MSSNKEETQKQGVKEEPQHGPMVIIFIKDKEKLIHRGHRTVIEIKTVCEVPLAWELEQVIDGKLTPLPDDGAVTIKGGERFAGHPKDSSSS